MKDLLTGATNTTTTGETPTYVYGRKPVATQTKKDNPLPKFKALNVVEYFKEAKESLKNKKNIFGELITKGDLTILFGKSNTGKSFLAYQIAEAIASGKNVLDVMSLVNNNSTTPLYDLKNETEAQPVIYFDFEASQEQNCIRYSDKNGNVYPFSTNITICTPEKYAQDNPLLFIQAMAEETKKTGAKVIFIDNLSAISIDNEKSSQAGKLMQTLRDYQRDNKLTIVIVAHTPKIIAGQPITENDLAGSKQVSNLADCVIAINTTSNDKDTRYIKQMKAKYNQKNFEGDNVITLDFCTYPNGFKGYEFLAYNDEESLIKIAEKSVKEEETDEIIFLVRKGDMSYTDIAIQLQPKYGNGRELKTYRASIKKQIQRMKNKGILSDTAETVKPATSQQVKPEASKEAQKQTSEALTPVKSTFEVITTHGSTPAISTPANNPILQRQREREAKEQEEDLKALFADLQEIEERKAI